MTCMPAAPANSKGTLSTGETGSVVAGSQSDMLAANVECESVEVGVSGGRARANNY